MVCTFVRFILALRDSQNLEDLVHRSGQPVVVEGVIEGQFEHASGPRDKVIVLQMSDIWIFEKVWAVP
jgi:hypothetical protein